MSYRIEILRSAQKEIEPLPGHARAQARQMIRALARDPRPRRAKELRAKPGIYRLWPARRWRLVFQIDEELKRVRVLRIRLKDEIDYESL